MVREMPARVYAGWHRFETREPFGPRQEDRRAGEIAALFATVHRDKKQHHDPYSPEEFFHSLLDTPPSQGWVAKKPKPPGQLLQIMEAGFLLKGRGEDHRKQKPRYEENE